MYITKNIYQRYVTYFDGKDIDIIHYMVEKAKSNYLENKEKFDNLTDEEISNIKKNNTPVIFASTVSSKDSNDFALIRSDMNSRAIRKYLIIDADFDENKEYYSNYLYNKIIEVAKEYNTPVIIYPTISYPNKPRFRAIMFTKHALNEKSYYQAMSWWYEKLEIMQTKSSLNPDLSITREILEDLDDDLIREISLASDTSNLNIHSNNNAPVFINSEQLDFIYDTSQDKNLELLDKSLWKDYKKPSIPTTKTYGMKNALDEIKLNDEILKEATLELAKTDMAKDYNTFWRILHSIARAETTEQISHEQAQNMLEWIAETGDSDEKVLEWKLNNSKQYAIELQRVSTNNLCMKRAKPLVSYPMFKNKILSDMTCEEIKSSDSESYVDPKINLSDKPKPRAAIRIKGIKSKNKEDGTKDRENIQTLNETKVEKTIQPVNEAKVEKNEINDSKIEKNKTNSSKNIKNKAKVRTVIKTKTKNKPKLKSIVSKK